MANLCVFGGFAALREKDLADGRFPEPQTRKGPHRALSTTSSDKACFSVVDYVYRNRRG